ncbi:Oligosaccharyltransferase subunit Ribophorin II-domain-containing protein [Kockovaella imperatae]|uniref:Oligosaccharyltransferase subunit Ribophorin II-domain-containing protein n=1 Tax=Kockovaella imperatae TaxID=4999 RepID=A0A1Y1UQ35_9TREE|nr:Oligosaccharyltransferase subunit Ribophorin II-domain-containing protein [Kockovaella imperatae]ORX39566.1 Oligosaccharyltransferase subunit Ribophorin II-domain-containing protein [Kockovaella imperatae]
MWASKLFTILAAASLVLGSKTPALGIKQGKIAITSPDGLHDATYPLEPPTSLSQPIVLSEGSTLKLTFNSVDKASGNAVFPQQAHLLFEDSKGGEDVTLPVSVKSNGRASWTFNTAKPISALTHTHGPLHLTLLLSALDSHTPLHYPIGELQLPSSILKAPLRRRHDLPPRQGEPAFQPQQELFHTFNQGEKSVGFIKSALGTGVVLSPWGVLLGLYSQISPKLDYKTPPSSAYLFLVSLAALEALIFVYWVGLRLYQLLPMFILLALVSAYTGKVALKALRSQSAR